MAIGNRAGRPAEDEAAKVLAGTWRDRPKSTPSFEPEPGLPPMPSVLSADGKAEWKRIAPLILPVISKVDIAVLVMYCQNMGTWCKMQRVLNRKGYTFTTKQGGYVQQRPEVAIAAKALKDATDAARELGLTPAARRRVSTTTKTEEQPSKWDRFKKKS